MAQLSWIRSLGSAPASSDQPTLRAHPSLTNTTRCGSWGEAARGQLLRMMASDAMRGAVERRFGVRLAFQNCHRVAVFRPGATGALAEFTTARAQILNQSPELANC
jgi:hypothetical protein